jgi:SAM-dependent methyltransferase
MRSDFDLDENDLDDSTAVRGKRSRRLLAEGANVSHAMSLAHSAARPHPAVVAYLDAIGRPEVPLAIDGRDEMLASLLHAHCGSIEAALVGYFQTGWMAAELLRRVLRWRFGDRGAVRVLDFASGYGRMTRHLHAERDRVRLTVADIEPEAVAFQRRELGVEGFVSTADPDDLAVDERFDVIFVASLFSHLPERRFVPWLRWLYRRLAPGGVLVVSTHGPESLLPGRALPAGGFHFETLSESRRLTGDEYGSTWVSAEFMARAIAEAAGDDASHRCFPATLWHAQDLYVVVPEPAADFSQLALHPGPRGYLDACHFESPERLMIAGWAADRDAAAGEVRVGVALNGAVAAEVTPALPRPEARAELGAAAERAGWALRLEAAEPFSPADLIVVTARSPRGLAVIHAGRLETANLYLDLMRGASVRDERERALAELRGVRAALAAESRRVAELDAAVHRLGWEKHALEQRLAAMRRSRFWRLRDAWFRLTGRGGEG